jgi:hypothetical protein
MRTSLGLAFVLIVVAPAAADSMLLVELHHEGNAHTYALGQRVPFEFHAFIGSPESGSRAYLGGLYSPADIGQTFSVAASELAEFQSLLASYHSNSEFLINSAQGYLIGTSFDVEQFWTATHFRLNATYFVPQLGFGLTGYRITNITQTIDDLREVRGASTVVHAGAQTIRIFGEALPPPPVYPPLNGDYNKNGTVDAADYIVWRKIMSMPEGSRPDLPNAINGPRPPVESDYYMWRYFYGESVPPIGASAVPEPASWILVALASSFVHRRKFVCPPRVIARGPTWITHNLLTPTKAAMKSSPTPPALAA